MAQLADSIKAICPVHQLPREGENSTSDIWFRYKARLVAKERGVAYTPALLEEVRGSFDPPAEIDFRMSAATEKKKPSSKA